VVEISGGVPSQDVPFGTLSGAELRDITAWLAAGGHDAPEVHAAVARAIHAELGGDAS
jgi:hypothetical protein